MPLYLMLFGCKYCRNQKWKRLCSSLRVLRSANTTIAAKQMTDTAAAMTDGHSTSAAPMNHNISASAPSIVITN